MLRKNKSPFLRDVYLAYLIDGAKRTKTDGYPIIEDWMVADKPPKDMIQWDRRNDAKEDSKIAMSFYCCDPAFQPILNNPIKYVEKLKKYYCIVGLDASPYDNMPLVVQKSQIFLNLACTFFYGMQGIKVIPNVRVGDDRTLSSLKAYPKHTLISIGTNGFIKQIDNRYKFADQVQKIIDYLEPSGICVYGKACNEIFDYASLKGIPIYQFDSYTMKQNKKDKIKNLSEEATYER